MFCKIDATLVPVLEMDNSCVTRIRKNFFATIGFTIEYSYKFHQNVYLFYGWHEQDAII
jgi:hypothetical protein